MSEKPNSTIQVTCPCCSATLTIDPTLSAVLNHKLPAKPQLVAELKNAATFVKEEATRRDEKYQQIVGSYYASSWYRYAKSALNSRARAK